MTIPLVVRRVGALAVAVLFFFVAIRVDVYNATSPPALSRAVFGPDVLSFAHPWWLSLHVWVRKAYSVVAFALVGYSAHHALRKTARPALRAATIVAAYSFGIEIAQHDLIGFEPVLESVLDVACGALGGWLAVVADRELARVWSKKRGALPSAARNTR